jgi:hypothetical protein
MHYKFKGAIFMGNTGISHEISRRQAIIAMVDGNGNHPVPVEVAKQTGIEHAFNEGRVDDLARKLVGLSVGEVLTSLGVDVEVT